MLTAFRSVFPKVFRLSRIHSDSSRLYSTGNMSILGADYVEELVDPKSLPKLVEDALDFAHCHGLVIRTREEPNRSDVCQNAPFALLPSPFPRSLFEEAIRVQKAMNLLYFRLSWSPEFLIDAHKDVVGADEFTRHMVECYRAAVGSDGPIQKISLLTQRADYMCHSPADSADSPQLKQIEVNNIAVSMGGLAQRCTQLHRRLLGKLGVSKAEIDSHCPDNRPIDLLANGLHKAWLLFGNANAAVLVVTENVNQNQLDQRFVEYELERLQYGITIIRTNLTEAYEKLRLDDSNELYFGDSQIPIGLVYFRAGYTPTNYPTDKEWAARLRMEQSRAIKCPWIGLQLANTKKVQQVLARPDIVERFLDVDEAAAVRATFAGLWGLERDDAETLTVLKDAMDNPERYVLKPQLEGGGGNFYGDAIRQKLNGFSAGERAAHILMQRIQPLVVKNYHIRAHQPAQLTKTVSELGTYGFLLGDGASGRVIENESSGQILRSKGDTVDEGGVAVGAAVIDTPFLI